MLDSNVINLVNSFVLDFNKTYKFVGFSDEKKLYETYDISFFKNLKINRQIPPIGDCLWFSYLLDLFLKEHNLFSKICLIKFNDGEEMKIHFLIKLVFNNEIFYLDYFNDILRISKKKDLIISIKNNLGNNYLFLDFIEYEYSDFLSDIYSSIFSNSLSDWDLNILIKRLVRLYSVKFKSEKTPNVILEVLL
jgi:hypothetical protein